MDEAALCLEPQLTAQGQHLLHSVPAKELAHFTAAASQSFSLFVLLPSVGGRMSWRGMRKVSVL